jgi:hypothetical protein
MHRKLHVDTLILIPTFNIYVFSYSRWTDERTNGQTDRQIEKLIWCGLGNLIGSSRLIRCGLGNLIGSSRYTRCAWAGETFFHCLRKILPAHSDLHV